MRTLAIEGMQWGDEGKGKITDFCASKAQIVVRSQGGNNAGHTIEHHGTRYALRLLPSGILNKDTVNVLADGMVINPSSLISEIEAIHQKGVKEFKLIISKRATLLLPYHIELDIARENALGEYKIGTTKNGIGPCYEDRSARLSIRVGDLLYPEYLKERIHQILPLKNRELLAYSGKQFTEEEIYDELMKNREILLPYITDTTTYLQKAYKEGKKILFEGAQGAMLCLTFGTYPYVTSSSPLATAIPSNTGLPLTAVDGVLGVMKAYTTRVGEGPFPSEIDNEEADAIREKGHEYGTVTHRPRRVGWLDIPQLKYVKEISGITHVAIMLLDVLSAVDEINICTGYTLNGEKIDFMPSNVKELSLVKPEFITLPSWKEDISLCKTYDELPENCRNYIETIEKYLDIDIDIISVSPDKDGTILKGSLLMIDRYLNKEMKDLFTDEHRFNAYWKVELAVMEAWSRIGVIDEKYVLDAKKNGKVNVERIHEIEAVTKHDVIAFTRQISETLGEERRYVHFGLTSTDVVDTAMSLLYKDANDILEKDILALLESLKKKALDYKDTPCIGRTHGMHAEITSFGLKWANYYDETKRALSSFKTNRRYVESAKLSGAVGNYADIDPRIQDIASEILGLESSAIATQVLSRDRHEHYASTLAILASTIEKIAVEIRNLSRSEIHEVEEGFSKGQKGSSAMPQKRNPISSENLTGCARMIRGYLFPILEDNALYHERDLTHSCVERVSLIDMIELTDYALRRMTRVIDNLTIFPEIMEKNIRLTNNSVFSSRVLSLLIEKGMTRESAYDLIQPSAMDSALNHTDFKENIKKNDEVRKHLSDNEIDSCFTFDPYLKHVDYIYKKVGII